MDGNTTTMAVILLAVFAACAGFFALSGAKSGSERKAAKRVTALAGRSAAGRGRGQASAADPADKRRKQVADSLKAIERKAAQQKARPTIKQRLEQAGLSATVSSFWLASLGVAVVVGLLTFLKVMNIWIALGAAFAAGLGLPRWVLNFLKNRRQKKFLNEFANSIDVIVRGVKSGLPLNDCLKMIGQEAPDPVGGEFRQIVENQRVGLPLEDCLKRFVDRIPLAEVNFFYIVLSIQQKAGGNLSEALGNLSAVLRDRKRLQGKIKALSSEAKSSAAIIGALPVVMMVLVYLTTPNYISALFTERLGNIMLAGCVAWMTIGVLVMKKMISFKY
ncbi:MAG: type II secretion system F family protein [Alphaproteobacteria bacterium]|nr:type II secretion system F family protein [Alphaproteobacteria bacterium]